MDKSTFKQLMKEFNELRDNIEKSRAASEEAQPTEPLSECDCNCDSCDYETSNDSTMTPLERLISDRINNHIKEGTFPSLEEAHVINILDSIDYRYNK